MDEQKAYQFFRNYIVRPQIDVKGTIQECLEKIISETLRDEPSTVFIRSNDTRLDKIRINESYLGESLLDVVTQLENEYPIAVIVIPNEEDGYDITLKYVKG